jgi:hypothetical protein
MKNIIKLLEVMRSITIIALVAIIGFSFAACGGDDDDGGKSGTFTLTDIPPQHNGKYAGFLGDDLQTENIIALRGYKKSKNDLTTSYPLISNGSVNIPVWAVYNNGKVLGYFGNDTVGSIVVSVYDAETSSIGQANKIGGIRFTSVPFSNGNAAQSWNDGYSGY